MPAWWRSLPQSVFLVLAILTFAVAQDESVPGKADFEAARVAIGAGDFDKAVASLEKALAAQVKAHGKRHRDVLETEHLLGYTLTHLGKDERAIVHFERARSIAHLLEGESSGRAAWELWFIANARIRLGQYAKAEASARQAHAGMMAAGGGTYRHDDRVLALIATACHHNGRLFAARRTWERVLMIRRRVLGPTDPATISALHELGKSEYELGEYEAAAEHADQALCLAEKLEPASPLFVAAAHALRGVALGHSGRREEALPDYRRALELRREHLGPIHASTATAENNLAGILRDLGRHDEAVKHYRNSIEIYSMQPVVSGPDLAWPVNGLAEVRRAQGKLEEAEKLCRKALAIREKSPGPGRKTLAGNLVTLAEILADQGRPEQAGEACRRAFEILVKSVDARHAEFRGVVELWRRLLAEEKRTKALAELDRRVAVKRDAEWASARNAAGVAEVQGRDEEAEYLWTRALRVAEGDASRTGIALAGRGRVRLDLARGDEGIEDLAAAAKAWRDAPPTEDFFRSQNLVRLARALSDRKHSTEAVAVWREALPILTRVGGADSRAVADARFGCALALIESGKHAEAIPHLEWVLPWFEQREGEDSTEVIGILEHLVRALQAEERWRESEKPARRWLRLAEARYASESPITRDAREAVRRVEKNTAGEK